MLSATLVLHKTLSASSVPVLHQTSRSNLHRHHYLVCGARRRRLSVARRAGSRPGRPCHLLDRHQTHHQDLMDTAPRILASLASLFRFPLGKFTQFCGSHKTPSQFFFDKVGVLFHVTLFWKPFPCSHIAVILLLSLLLILFSLEKVSYSKLHNPPKHSPTLHLLWSWM